MKATKLRKLLVISLSIILVTGSQSAFGAAAKIGGPCKSLDSFKKSGSAYLVCAKVSGKKVWRKSTTTEKNLYLKEVARRSADKAAADKAAADKAAADKAAADKAAADKAAADKAAADKAAADKAAAEVPNLIVGKMFSGGDADNPNWKWTAVKVTNTATTKIYSHQFFDVSIADSSGGVVDSSSEGSFPLLGPSASAWYVITQFNALASSQIFLQKRFSTLPSPLLVSELPTSSNAQLINSSYDPSKKLVQVMVKNNSTTKIISKSSTAYAVLLDASGVPIYAVRGFFDKAILPGGSANIILGSSFTFNGQVASIQVSIAPFI